MGCDIHIVIQIRDEDGWREVLWQETPWADNQKLVPGIPVAPKGFDDRNYDLFGILADVRNGTGFAGCLTGDGWPSIAPHRGFPRGFDPERVSPTPGDDPMYGPRFIGDHSHSWVELDELKAFPWDSVVTKIYGVVPADKYEELAKVGDQPTSYCGDTFGPGIQVYEPDEYWAAKAAGNLVPKPYVRMSWDESARSATRDWPDKVIPWLHQLADGRPLRLVFGFDS